MTYPDWEQLKRDSFGGSYMREPGLAMIDAQTPTFMARPLARTAADLDGADVVIIGAPYLAGTGDYAGVAREHWIAGPQRVRQQSARYRSGYIQDFDIDIFEHLTVVDYGNADCDVLEQTPENILAAQAAVEAKVNDALAAGAIPIVIGQNSPCGSFAIAKATSEHVDGKVGMISLDTHWDAAELDALTGDPRIAGAGSWKHKTYEFLENFTVPNLVEIGERGMMEPKQRIRSWIERGARFYPMWAVRTRLGIEGLCEELAHAYDGTEGVYVHFDMDVIGGAGPAPGDLLGELSEPIGMSDYEVIRIAHEIGRRGLTSMSFICIPPGSKSVYRLIVYIIAYLMAGLIEGRRLA